MPSSSATSLHSTNRCKYVDNFEEVQNCINEFNGIKSNHVYRTAISEKEREESINLNFSEDPRFW